MEIAPARDQVVEEELSDQEEVTTFDYLKTHLNMCGFGSWKTSVEVGDDALKMLLIMNKSVDRNYIFSFVFSCVY